MKVYIPSGPLQLLLAMGTNAHKEADIQSENIDEKFKFCGTIILTEQKHTKIIWNILPLLLSNSAVKCSIHCYQNFT